MLNNFLNHAAKFTWIILREFENSILYKEIGNEDSHQLSIL
jgi:hypothetical protein